jgi:hypothetical protein
MLSVYLIYSSYLILSHDYLFFKLMLNSRKFKLEDCIFEDLGIIYGIGFHIYYVAGLSYKLTYVTGNSLIISTFQYQNVTISSLNPWFLGSNIDPLLFFSTPLGPTDTRWPPHVFVFVYSIVQYPCLIHLIVCWIWTWNNRFLCVVFLLLCEFCWGGWLSDIEEKNSFKLKYRVYRGCFQIWWCICLLSNVTRIGLP